MLYSLPFCSVPYPHAWFLNIMFCSLPTWYVLYPPVLFLNLILGYTPSYFFLTLMLGTLPFLFIFCSSFKAYLVPLGDWVIPVLLFYVNIWERRGTDHWLVLKTFWYVEDNLKERWVGGGKWLVKQPLNPHINYYNCLLWILGHKSSGI